MSCSRIFLLASLTLLAGGAVVFVGALGQQAPKSAAAPPKHFSMIRSFHLADFFTVTHALHRSERLRFKVEDLARSVRDAVRRR